MPTYKYRIFDLWYSIYTGIGKNKYWYSELSACLAYDILSENFPGRYEIHKIKMNYPIVVLS